MDRITQAQRSALMAKIRGKDTGPERVVRRLVHGLGFRFRLHKKGLPGTPDLALVRLQKAIFIHGCFWHAHACPRGRRIPQANRGYWVAKRRRNRVRDRHATKELTAQGWGVLELWECELADEAALLRKLRAFLGRRRLSRPPLRS